MTSTFGFCLSIQARNLFYSWEKRRYDKPANSIPIIVFMRNQSNQSTDRICFTLLLYLHMEHNFCAVKHIALSDQMKKKQQQTGKIVMATAINGFLC